MIQTLIVDDEPHCIRKIQHLLQPYLHQFKVVATCHTVDEAIKTVNNHAIDLIFLDIEIHDKTGFEFLNTLAPITFDVIFTTGYNHYAIEAFEYAALHYLQKPVTKTKFKEAINRFIEKSKQASKITAQLDMLNDTINNKQKKKVTITTQKNGLEIFKLKEVIYFRADENYCKMIMKNDKSRLVSKALKHFETTLKGTSFFRIHKSYFINTDHVVKYMNGIGGYVILSNGSNLPVSKHRKTKFLDFLKQR